MSFPPVLHGVQQFSKQMCYVYCFKVIQKQNWSTVLVFLTNWDHTAFCWEKEKVNLLIPQWMRYHTLLDRWKQTMIIITDNNAPSTFYVSVLLLLTFVHLWCSSYVKTLESSGDVPYSKEDMFMMKKFRYMATSFWVNWSNMLTSVKWCFVSVFCPSLVLTQPSVCYVNNILKH